MRRNVDLPAPLAPITPKQLPSVNFRFTSLNSGSPLEVQAQVGNRDHIAFVSSIHFFQICISIPYKRGFSQFFTTFPAFLFILY